MMESVDYLEVSRGSRRLVVSRMPSLSGCIRRCGRRLAEFKVQGKFARVDTSKFFECFFCVTKVLFARIFLLVCCRLVSLSRKNLIGSAHMQPTIL